MKPTYASFDPADYLDNDEVIAEYLTAAVEDPDPNMFLAALGDAAKARGMARARVARQRAVVRHRMWTDATEFSFGKEPRRAGPSRGSPRR